MAKSTRSLSLLLLPEMVNHTFRFVPLLLLLIIGLVSSSPGPYYYKNVKSLKNYQQPQQLYQFYQDGPSPFFSNFFQQNDNNNNYAGGFVPAAPVKLFSPNQIHQPAESSGQIEEYNKAVEEEAKEAQKELLKAKFGEGSSGSYGGGFLGGDGGFGGGAQGFSGPTSYVQVQLQGHNKKPYNYGYSI